HGTGPDVGLLLPNDHAPERGLASTVRTNEAHNGPSGDIKTQVVIEHGVAIALGNAFGTDNHIAQTWAGWNGNLALFIGALFFLRHQVVILVDARLGLGLPGSGGHVQPLQLTLQRFLSGTFGASFVR